MTQAVPVCRPYLAAPSEHPPQGDLRWAYVVVLLLAVLSYVDIAAWPLHDPDEFNYITAAREMVEGGDWVTPHFNGAPRLVKPVLFYWIIAGAYKVFGIHVVVARLCSALAAAVGVLAVGLTAHHLMGTARALLAAAIVASNVAVLQFSRAAMPDPTLWAFVALANYAFLRLHFTPDYLPSSADELRLPWFSHLFFACAALALLTKGPIALVWCFLPLACAVLRAEWTGMRRLRWTSGAAILIILVVPWTALFIARNAAALRAQLLDPHSTQSYAYFARPVSTFGQFLDAGPQLASNFLVWLPAMLAAMLAALGDRLLGAGGSRPRDSSRWRGFFLLWIVLLVVVYAAFYKKSIRYMFPIAGPASILLADVLSRLLSEPRRRRDNAVLLGICGSVALFLAGALIAALIRTQGVDKRWIWPHALIQLAAGLVLLGGCTIAHVQRAFPAVLAGCVFLHMGLLARTLQPFADREPRTLAPQLRVALRPDEPLLCYRIGPRVLVFEARRTQVDLQSFPTFLKRLDGARACFIREADWQRVPELQRRGFKVIGSCFTFRSPPILSLDLARNRESALLLLRE